MTITVMHNSETGATRVVDSARPFTWDEPEGCASPRGWLMNSLVAACVGFYLDYGPDHNRPHHVSDIGGGRTVSFCQPVRLCQDCQPGSILCVRYPNGPRSEPNESRYVETIAQARAYVSNGD